MFKILKSAEELPKITARFQGGGEQKVQDKDSKQLK